MMSTRSARVCLVLGALVSSALACEGDRASGADASRLSIAPKIPTVVFLTERGEVPIRVDVARTQKEKTQGLMYVEHLDDARGMLFLMGPPERKLTFWMQNTFIPLDMIFVNARYEIVGIVENAEPLTTSPRGVETPSTYVIEVNGGWTAARGVVTGGKVRLENID
jgi:uncharacterized membrane protein (UPF0127 family)